MMKRLLSLLLLIFSLILFINFVDAICLGTVVCRSSVYQSPPGACPSMCDDYGVCLETMQGSGAQCEGHNQPICALEPGCTWYNCSGDPSCSYYGYQCNTLIGCYDPSGTCCRGYVNCTSYPTSGSCPNPECSWDTGTCIGGVIPGVGECENFHNQQLCGLYPADCTWRYGCYGGSSCNSFPIGTCEDYNGCTWGVETMGDSCGSDIGVCENGTINCYGICTDSTGPSENPESSCSDGLDNDCDSFTDCNDSDCDPCCDQTPACNNYCTGGTGYSNDGGDTCYIDSSCNTQCCPATADSYPTNEWDRTWCQSNAAGVFSAHLNDVPDWPSTTFDNNWFTGSPGFGIPADLYGFRSGKQINFPSTTTYTFLFGSNDGVDFWIDNNHYPIFWGLRDYGVINKTTILITSGWHNLRIDYFENTGDSRVSFDYFYCGDGTCNAPDESCFNCAADCSEVHFDPGSDSLLLTNNNSPLVIDVNDYISPNPYDPSIQSLFCYANGADTCVCSGNFFTTRTITCTYNSIYNGSTDSPYVDMVTTSCGTDTLNLDIDILTTNCAGIGTEVQCNATQGCGWWSKSYPNPPPSPHWNSPSPHCRDASCQGTGCVDGSTTFPYYGYHYGGTWACDGRFGTVNMTGVVETCDGTDENCDFVVDENLFQPCSTICGSGLEECYYGSWVNCTAQQPTIETCNGVDDDCDSSIDEPGGYINCDNCEYTCLSYDSCSISNPAVPRDYGSDLYSPAGPMQASFTKRNCCGDDFFEKVHDLFGTNNDACCKYSSDCVSDDTAKGILGGCYQHNLPPAGQGDDYTDLAHFLCYNTVWYPCTQANHCDQVGIWTCTKPGPSPFQPWGWYLSTREYCVDGIDNNCNGLIDEYCPCELYTFNEGENWKVSYNNQAVASLDVNGVLAIKGNIVTTPNHFVRTFNVRDKFGNIVSSIDQEGNLFASGTLYQGVVWSGVPSSSPTEKEVIIRDRDETRFPPTDLAIFQQDGDVIIYKCVRENTPDAILNR